MAIKIPELRAIESLVNFRRSIEYDRPSCKLKLANLRGIEVRGYREIDSTQVEFEDSDQPIERVCGHRLAFGER